MTRNPIELDPKNIYVLVFEAHSKRPWPNVVMINSKNEPSKLNFEALAKAHMIPEYFNSLGLMLNNTRKYRGIRYTYSNKQKSNKNTTWYGISNQGNLHEYLASEVVNKPQAEYQIHVFLPTK